MRTDSVDVKQPTTTTTTTNKGGMHGVNSNFENDAKMASLVRRLEAVEMSKGAQFSALEPSKPMISAFFVLCDSHNHLVE